MPYYRFLLCLAGLLLSVGVQPDGAIAQSQRKQPALPKDTLPTELSLDHLPAGLNARPAIPADSPLTAERVALGRSLFFDPMLSENNTVACASCHQPRHGFAAPDAGAIGIHGQVGLRNAPSLLNRAYGTRFFWDGRAGSLEEQALKPIANPKELGSSVATVLKKLKGNAAYVKQFQQAFATGGAEAVSEKNLGKALASFQRTLLLADSPIDQFRAGNVSALSAAERQGLWLYESRGRCWRCHSGHNFTDESFHNTGVRWGKRPIDVGRFDITGREADVGKFKTPTLRGVMLTAPYMHDGSVKTLRDVVQFYNRGGVKNPNLDPIIQPLDLSDADVDHLVAFLEALSRTSDPLSVLSDVMSGGTPPVKPAEEK
jgi:cytochrome c peroxidase